MRAAFVFALAVTFVGLVFANEESSDEWQESSELEFIVEPFTGD